MIKKYNIVLFEPHIHEILDALKLNPRLQDYISNQVKIQKRTEEIAALTNLVKATDHDFQVMIKESIEKERDNAYRAN